jgi:hypothetical protein
MIAGMIGFSVIGITLLLGFHYLRWYVEYRSVEGNRAKDL